MNPIIKDRYEKAKRIMQPQVISVDSLPTAAAGFSDAGYQFAYLNGDKFYGGYGETQLHLIDYWTLRQRSIQLYNENLYAEGIINSFITNIVNTGLTLECTPSAEILGVDTDFLNEWTEQVESRFKMYCDNPKMCDYHGEKTYSELQAQRELQAFVEGDVLIVYHYDRNTFLPKVELISAACVQSPIDGDVPLRKNHTVEWGVEKDPQGREVAYWVVKKNGNYQRFPKFGERSGRRIANLYRPGKNLMCHTRGMPLIANVLQSLREIDRYRDSVQRKALAASFIALAVEKDADTVSSRALGSAASRTVSGTVGNDYSLNMKQFQTGIYIDDMPAGHKIKMMGSDGTDLAFGDFEAAIINAIAWSKQMPPEILKKQFGSNYAASKQANSEFKIFLNEERSRTTIRNDAPLYREWLYVEVVKGNIQADGLIESWSDPDLYQIKGAWCSSDWSGAIKPNADMNKEALAQRLMVEDGFTTRDRASKELTGTKFSSNVKRVAKENQMLAEAMRPMLELQRDFGETAVNATMKETLIASISEDNLNVSS